MEHFLLSDTEKEELKQFIGAEAELPDMLNARERRVLVQEKLLGGNIQEFSVSFTLNIPGPVKVLPYVPETFELALKEILQALSDSGIPVLKRSLILDRTGPEAFLCVDADALDVKRLLVPLEDASKLGRLYDIDIIGRDGKKISRSDIGKPGRTLSALRTPCEGVFQKPDTFRGGTDSRDREDF